MLAAALMISGTLAQSSDSGRIPGTNIYYIPKKDAMTDANQGSVVIPEINDTNANTYFVFQCRESGNYDVYLNTKNPLMSQNEYDTLATPALMFRVDSQPPKTMKTSGATRNGEPDLTILAFSDTNAYAIYSAFATAQSKVTVRILRNELSALDYVFPAKGFLAAFKKVNACQ